MSRKELDFRPVEEMVGKRIGLVILEGSPLARKVYAGKLIDYDLEYFIFENPNKDRGRVFVPKVFWTGEWYTENSLGTIGKSGY